MVSTIRKYFSRFFSFFFKKHAPAPEKTPRKADGIAPEKTEKEAPRKADGIAPEKLEKEAPRKADGIAPEKTEKEAPRKADGIAPEKTGKETPSQADAAVEADQTVLPEEVPSKEVSRRAKRDKKRKTRLKKAETQPSYPVSKNGIRVLTRQDSLSEIFTGERTREPSKPKPCELPGKKDDWIRILENSLSGEKFQTLLQEKRNSNLISRAPTVTERIRHYPRPQDEIDLHGYTAGEAEAKTEQFIEDARHRGIRTLRIIVGKGLHSQGKAVLRDVVEDRLAYLKKKQAVLSFQWEKHHKLKSGSIIVYLI